MALAIKPYYWVIMPDENTTDSPASNAPESPAESVETTPSAMADAEGSSGLPREPVQAPPSVTADAKGSKAPAIPKTTAKVIPSAAGNPVGHHELRIEPRMRVRWHADAFIDGQGLYQGFIKDISLNGTDIFLDINLQKVKSLKVRIYVPPLSKKSDPHVMEVSGKVIYTAYDSNEFRFHTGVRFLQFDLASDLALLQSRIAVANHPG